MCALSSKNQLINVKLDFNEVFFVFSLPLFILTERISLSPPPQKKRGPRSFVHIYLCLKQINSRYYNPQLKSDKRESSLVKQKGRTEVCQSIALLNI